MDELREEFQEFRRELRQFRRLQIKVWVTMIVGFVALIVEINLR